MDVEDKLGSQKPMIEPPFEQLALIDSMSPHPRSHVGSLEFDMPSPLTSIEICAGAGGQAWGLELAGFEHVALIDNDAWACETLRVNRPNWRVTGPHVGDSPLRRQGKGDVKLFDVTAWRGDVDLLAGGVPCPPFSIAGKQLGSDDDRDLFPSALRMVHECKPRAVMLENVPGIMGDKFADFRSAVIAELRPDYKVWWGIVNSSDFGVPQLRPRAVLVAIENRSAPFFEWPGDSDHVAPPTVGEALFELMSEDGWHGAEEWAHRIATRIAPTLVGGSKKHGGPDLGPTRAKQAWAKLGVDGHGIADAPPTKRFSGAPRLTVEMAAVIQGFDPARWAIQGRKTAAYRQIGNAFPPPVAKAFGVRIAEALRCGIRPQLTVKRGGKSEMERPRVIADERLTASAK